MPSKKPGRKATTFSKGFEFHNYITTGNTREDAGITKYETKCKKCGHKFWLSSKQIRNRIGKPSKSCQRCYSPKDRKPTLNKAPRDPNWRKDTPLTDMGRAFIAGKPICSMH